MSSPSQSSQSNQSNQSNQFGHTALIRSILNNNRKQALTLIEKGTDLNTKDIHGFSPLMYAVRRGQFKVTKCLLEKGCDVNIQNNLNQSALHLITKSCFREPKRKYVWEKLLGILIENGADVNLKEDSEFSPLMWAVKVNQTGMVKRLIKAGADVNVQNNCQERCLDIAAKSKNNQIIELLLCNGADVNYKSLIEFQPLMWAVEKNNIKMVEMLIKPGADVNFKNQNSETCLDIAIKLPNLNLEVIECLLSNGADVNTVDLDYQPPLVRETEARFHGKLTDMETTTKLIHKDVNSQYLFDKNSISEVIDDRKAKVWRKIMEIEGSVLLFDIGNFFDAVEFAFKQQFIKIMILLFQSTADPDSLILKEFYDVDVCLDDAIRDANILMALIKHGLRTDVVPYPSGYTGLLCNLLIKTNYDFNDIRNLFDILYLSGSNTQNQLSSLLQDPLISEDIPSGSEKREWIIEKCRKPMTLKEISRMNILKYRRNNISIYKFINKLEIESPLREYLTFSEFKIDN